MRTLLFYAENYTWRDSKKDDQGEYLYPDDTITNGIVAFVHVEPDDNDPEKSIMPRLLKQIKQTAKRWDTETIVLYSFAHLGEVKAEPNQAKSMVKKINKRLSKVGFTVLCTPYLSYVDFALTTPGAPNSRVYREFN